MAERPEDLNLPITVVQRIIKEALPDGVIVSKEARQTICRASSVFVLYLTSCAVTHANKAKRKTLAVNDILSAINDMEFDSFTQPLQDILKFRKENTSNQANKKQNKKNTELSKDDEGEVEVEEEEEEVDDGNVEDDENEQNTNEDEQNEDENDEEKENANERKVKKRKTENKSGSNTNQEETEEAEENQNENESEEDSSASENEMN